MSSQGKAPEAAATTTEAKCEGFVTTSSQMIGQRARKRIARARLWAEENPGAFSYMESEAVAHAAAGRRFGAQELAEWVRRADFTDRHGMPTRVNNTLVPALARLLVAKHPECRPLVEFRTHAYDGLVGVTDR